MSTPKEEQESEKPLVYIKMPKALALKVRTLITENKLENPGDVQWAQEALIRPEETTKATVDWFRALVKRKGKKWSSATNL
jgi:hypothetical protein